MTKQEAEVLVVRLVRVWQPEKVKPFRYECDGDLNWSADLRRNIYLGVTFYADDNEAPSFYMRCDWGKEFAASLYLDGDGYVDQVTVTSKNMVAREFTQRFLFNWSPIFRRNCWLSGADIEATAHEKMEWMQGFSREEIEAWNLNL